MSFRAAAIWSLIYVVIALLFGVLLGLIAGWDLGTQFLAGYVVERSLSVDNLFVFVIILSTFAVPAEYQGRALAVGIALALVLRAIFIALGAALLSAFSFMFLIFGLALIATAVQLFRHRDEDPSVSDNAVVAFARRRLPLTDRYDGSRIVTRVDGRRMLTPVFIVLIAIGTTDFLFALDSIPAVYGVTTHPYIVLAANVFALVGLRPLFFLVAGLLDRLVYLSTGLSVILIFVGAKLVLHFAHLQHHSIPEISTGASLAVVVVVLAVTTIASLARVRRQPSLRAHAGSLHARHGEAARAAPGEAGRAPRGAAQATDTR
jgi:tellurite resistance protein TerC